MKYSALGSSDLSVSNICLGAANFGQADYGCDEQAAHDILDAFIGEGGNFIDTADQYGTPRGRSEEIIGRWLKNQKRDNVVLATKCYFGTEKNIDAIGLSHQAIIQSCEASLKRLNTDYIDLYQAHRYDPNTPLEETLKAFDMLIRQGKVRYIGFSDFSGWHVAKAQALAKSLSINRFVSGQYLYNLLKRDIEAEVVPACTDSNTGVLCWAPLSGGMLTGKYLDQKTPPANTRIANKKTASLASYQKWYQNSINIVQNLRKIAAYHNQTPATVALAWLLNNEFVTSVIVGAKNKAQCKENCAAGAWMLPDKDWNKLEALSRIKHPYPNNE